MIQRIAVIGAGTMGSGIAQVAATAGLDVLLVDANAAQTTAACARIADSVARLVKKGTLTVEAGAAIPGRIGHGRPGGSR